MKPANLLFVIFIIYSCTKKIGNTKKDNSVTEPVQKLPGPCVYTTVSTVTYSNSIKGILLNNCMPCHSTPGSGGINLDSYQASVDLANSGQLLQVIQNMDPNNTMMPPPPQKHLDSCEIKALNLWIKQGCPLN